MSSLSNFYFLGGWDIGNVFLHRFIYPGKETEEPYLKTVSAPIAVKFFWIRWSARTGCNSGIILPGWHHFWRDPKNTVFRWEKTVLMLKMSNFELQLAPCRDRKILRQTHPSYQFQIISSCSESHMTIVYIAKFFSTSDFCKVKIRSSILKRNTESLFNFLKRSSIKLHQLSSAGKVSNRVSCNWFSWKSFPPPHMSTKGQYFTHHSNDDQC